MLDPRTRILAPDDLKKMAARLALESQRFKGKPRLQTDLVLASRLITTLLRTGVINKPVDLEGRCDD